MYFFVTHKLIHNVIPWSKETKEGQKNIITFFVGVILYIITFGLLTESRYKVVIDNNILLTIMRNFFFYFFLTDVCTMACIYKLFFRRTIFCEAAETLHGVNEDSRNEKVIDNTTIDDDDDIESKNTVDGGSKEEENVKNLLI
jgi:hypothetical protein